MDNQYDVSEETRKLFELKQKQRAESKEYYQKLLYNPYRPINSAPPFDPALMRLNALQLYRHTIYRTNPKFYLKAFALLCPMFLLYYSVQSYKNNKEKICRSGVLTYEERYNKIYY